MLIPTVPETKPIKLSVRNMDFSYGQKKVLDGLSMDIHAERVTAIIGPSGCGKSTFLRSINRMHDLLPGARASGRILLDGEDVLDRGMDVVQLRQRVGMVFQRSNPFPKSIYDNVAWGPRLNRTLSRSALDDVVEHALRRAALWDEVKDRLRDSAIGLSGGQQQRLCIARALAVDPEVILMDEPASALDPIATLRIEELIAELRKKARGHTLTLVYSTRETERNNAVALKIYLERRSR